MRGLGRPCRTVGAEFPAIPLRRWRQRVQAPEAAQRVRLAAEAKRARRRARRIEQRAEE